MDEDDGAEDEDDDVPTFNLLVCSGGGALRDGKCPRPDAPRAGEHDENMRPMGSSQLPAKQQLGRQHRSQQQPGGSHLKELLLGQQDNINLEE
ncbi:hypothetical protein FOA52_014433 [Chlamydomonas sp. UWO 241]|nr:hypothetical protein FOA52_014433 [Chlamydomonas sp. UWO 241]